MTLISPLGVGGLWGVGQGPVSETPGIKVCDIWKAFGRRYSGLEGCH